ncbi:MAG: hypothetical protein AB1758_13550, partial [Candidatus Eremiobacterota bacterium]
GQEYFLEVDRTRNRSRFRDQVVELVLDRSRLDKPLEANLLRDDSHGHVLEMKCYFWMERCLSGVLNPSAVNYVNVRYLEEPGRLEAP